MNYRHAFHAGNHADVFKHAALSLVLDHLLGKPQPFTVLDTHAGAGVYDLTSESAQKTREYVGGIGAVFERGLPQAETYLDVVRAISPTGLTAYPGSPEIVRRRLRDDDRLIACELHPTEFEALRERYRGDRRIALHHRDGYEAIGALLPPTPRRGLVLIDPPFEQLNEAQRLAQALTTGLRRWPAGIFLAWYPVKDRQIGDYLARVATGASFPKALRAEFVPFPDAETGLAGSGLIVCNAPWRLDEKLTALCEALAPLLGRGDATWSVDWLTPA
jgi:23S rRNA (adenine2030-N6)-methyltransferase